MALTDLCEFSFDADEGDPGMVCCKVLRNVQYERVHSIELGNSADNKHQI